MQLGMVGLGRMGANIVRRLQRDGHDCVVYDIDPGAVAALEADGAAGAGSLEELVAKLAAPRHVWVMLPAGEITETTVTGLAQLLAPGDAIVDGGNTYYRDDIRRAATLGERGHPLRGRRHERRRVRARARLLPDGRRPRRRIRAARADLRLAGAGRGRRRPHARPHRAPRARRNGATSIAARPVPATS